MKLAIFGYGNVGREVLMNALLDSNIRVVGVFTRRQAEVKKRIDAEFKNVPVFDFSDLKKEAHNIDMVALCTGSATDTAEWAKVVLEHCNLVDCFDNHKQMPDYIKSLKAVGEKSGKLALSFFGWDPGLFSLLRATFTSIFPQGEFCTAWGSGISQGHSNAVRSIDGVLEAVAITAPKINILNKFKREGGDNDPKKLHYRDVYVVLKEDVHLENIEKKIKTMPDYFEGYDVRVTALSGFEFATKFGERLPHGGRVLGIQRKNGVDEKVEFIMETSSNPKTTAQIMLAGMRACWRLNQLGKKGCLTLLDIPIRLLLPNTSDYTKLI